MLDFGFATAQSHTLDVPRPGFGAVREAPAGNGGRAAVLAGWELPFLRGFSDGTRRTIELAGRPMLDW